MYCFCYPLNFNDNTNGGYHIVIERDDSLLSLLKKICESNSYFNLIEDTSYFIIKTDKKIVEKEFTIKSRDYLLKVIPICDNEEKIIDIGPFSENKIRSLISFKEKIFT